MNILKIKKFLCAVMALSFSAWAIADTYVYDPLNRLTTVTCSSGGSQTSGYHAADSVKNNALHN